MGLELIHLDHVCIMNWAGILEEHNKFGHVYLLNKIYSNQIQNTTKWVLAVNEEETGRADTCIICIVHVCA